MVKTREARWVTVREFPIYEISDQGEIFNTRTQRYIKPNLNNHGHLKVNFVDFDGSHYTRSVALLVAESFIRPPSYMCDSVIILDGDFTNVRASNLAWRPIGFAWKYTHQLKVEQPASYYNLPVRNIVTGVEYDSIVQAGMTEGLLFDDIDESIASGWEIFPTGSIFQLIR